MCGGVVAKVWKQLSYMIYENWLTRMHWCLSSDIHILDSTLIIRDWKWSGSDLCD